MQISSRESEVLYGDIYPSEFYEESQIYSEILDEPSKENDFNKNETPSKEDDVIKSKTKGEPSLIKITETEAISIDLPSILWHGYNATPKFMYITNTGRTILINGQWSGNRPYIEGGPLNGTYQFSQVHFHSPSEHEVNGKRYPLEMHVVHFKTCYLTQERAMHEKDGTVVLVYLFEVMEEGETSISSVTKLAPKIEKVNSQIETKNLTLDQFVKPFSSKYYVYWGSVATAKNSYLLQWIVHCDNLCVTRQEVDDLLGIINFRETSANHTPRMKPENDAIYYVEENEEFEKLEQSERLENLEKSEDFKTHEHAHCSTCHLMYEWWRHYCEQNSARSVEMYTQNSSALAGSAEMHKDDGILLPGSKGMLIENEKLSNICGRKKKADCVNEVDLVCDSGRSASSLCVCVHKKKKRRKQKAETSASSEAGSKSSVNEEKENSEKKKKLCLAEQVQSSCPSFASENVEGACIVPLEPCQPKATSSCPETTISSKLFSCGRGEKKKFFWKKCCEKGLQVTISCLSNTSRKEKKKKEKKKDSDCSEPESSNPNSPVKKKSDKSKKKSKTNIEVEENEKTEKKKKNKKKETKMKNNKKDEENTEKAESGDIKIPITVQYSSMIQSTPIGFKTILREFDNLLENRNKSRVSNISTKSPTSQESSTSRETENKAGKEIFTLGGKNDIKTLFKKKKETPRLPEPAGKQSSIDYLLTSIDDQYSHCSGVVSPSLDDSIGKKTSDLSFFLRPEDFKWSEGDVSVADLPSDKTSDMKNELCVQMELLFHSDNGVFSGSSDQEYDLALLYNQKILQEYKGVLHPNKLEVGHYEKLELFPKYPELGGLSVQLKDCTVKLESPDQLCMRAKFLLKEPDFDGVTSEIRENMSENPPKALLILNDAVTQCSLKESVDKEVDCLMDIEQNVNMFDRKCRERYPKRIPFPDSHLDESEKEKPVDEIILKAGTSECKIRLDPNPDIDLDQSSKHHEYESIDLSIGSDKEKAINGKDISTKAAKELKNLFSNQKKTIYFLYEKIEKDENSGKKIFVGSFRTKEEMEALSKEKPSHQDVKPAEAFENKEERNMFLFPNKKTDSEKVLRVECEPEMKTESFVSTGSQNKKRDSLTLHKYTTKTNTLKKEHVNVAVGKVINELNQNSQNFKRLIDLIGIDKRKKPKVFIYELQETSGVSGTSSSTIGKKTKNLPSVQDHIARGGMSLLKKPKVKNPRCESPVTLNQKTLSEKVSQSALIIIPVEVESLSKVEVILIQHSSSVKNCCKNKEKEIIPCLNYYK